MRIAYVTETWHPSVDGVVTRLEATLTELGRRGHRALVVAPEGGEAAFDGVAVVGVPAVGIPFLAGGKPWGLPVARVGRALREFRPDVVHAVHPFVVGLAGVAAARRHHVPLVASFHQDIARVAGYYHLSLLQPVIWAYTRRLQGMAAANLVTSRVAAATLAEHGIDGSVLWPYGVDLDRFNPARRSERARRVLTGGASADIVALYVGRLAPEKDLDRLAPLADTNGVHLAIIGDGPLRSSLETRLGGPSVTFLGALHGTALAEAYASADVFVFPSTTETLGLVLLEAIASGLPVVAFDTDTSREILADAGSRLCPVTALGLLPTMVRDVGTPGSEWSRRSAQARQAAERWSWGAATERLIAVYEAVINTDQHRDAAS